jgi:hypothetical protein
LVLLLLLHGRELQARHERELASLVCICLLLCSCCGISLLSDHQQLHVGLVHLHLHHPLWRGAGQERLHLAWTRMLSRGWGVRLLLQFRCCLQS